jgi:hypothetical protein
MGRSMPRPYKNVAEIARSMLRQYKVMLNALRLAALLASGTGRNACATTS